MEDDGDKLKQPSQLINFLMIKLANNQMEGDNDDDLNQALFDSIMQVILQVAEDGDGNAKAQ